MEEMHTMEWSVLMDLLSEQTAIYTKLLAERNRTLEFENAKTVIKQIQAEVSRRKIFVDESNEHQLFRDQEFSVSRNII